VHRRLTQASAEWERQGRHPSELYRGPRLASARAWAAGHPGTLNATEREFLLRGIVEEGVGLRDWLTASGSSREALALAEAYLTSGEAAQQLKGLAILRWLPEPDLEAEIDHRLLEVVQSDRYREAVRERAVEALTERGRADRLADQLRSAGLSPDERSRLIDALGHARNVPKLGVGATNAVGGLDRLRVHWSSVRKLVWVYRTQFGIVFAFSYIATELTWGVLSSLPLFGVGIGLPYSPRALVLTCVCVFYVLFRAYLDERAVSTREVLLATALAIAVHNVLNVFSALRLLGQLFELLTSTLYLAIVAIALSVGPGRGNVRARLLTLSALASALSTALTVVSAFLISPEGFRSRDLPLMILLMWTNGAIVTFACLVAFHQALRIAFGETLLYGAASGADP